MSKKKDDDAIHGAVSRMFEECAEAIAAAVVLSKIAKNELELLERARDAHETFLEKDRQYAALVFERMISLLEIKFGRASR